MYTVARKQLYIIIHTTITVRNDQNRQEKECIQFATVCKHVGGLDIDSKPTKSRQRRKVTLISYTIYTLI